MAMVINPGHPRRGCQVAVLVLCAFSMHIPAANGASCPEPAAMTPAPMEGAVLLPLDSVAPPSRELPDGSKPPPNVAAPPGRRKNPAPVVRMGRVEASGDLPVAIVRNIVRQDRPRHQLCYEKGLARNRKLEGQVVLRFEVDREGRPSNVLSAGSTLPDAKVMECVIAVTTQLWFPKPHADPKSPEGMRVLVPWFFSPS